MGCSFIIGLPPALNLPVPIYTFGGEGHHESKVSCPRTQHSDFSQDLNPGCSIWTPEHFKCTQAVFELMTSLDYREYVSENVLWFQKSSSHFLRCCRWEHLVYQLGGHDDVIKFVIKSGKIVHSRPH